MKKQLIIGITVLFIVSCFVYVLSELYSAKILVPPDLKAGLNPAADVSSETEKMSPDEARRHQIRQLAEREQLKLGMEFKNAEIKWHLEQDEAYCFFEDLCTVAEIHSMAQRLEVACLLRQKKTYNEIAQMTGASTATISRVNRALVWGRDGYKNILDRISEPTMKDEV